jgi:DNA-binding NarL/FixJ family response regulator
MDSTSAGPRTATCLLLADRHRVLLEGVQGLLGSRFDAVVTVSDEKSLLECVRWLHPTLAVIDLDLAPDGLGVLRRLREQRPDQRLIVLSLYDSPVVAAAAIRAGADAFVLKRAIADELLTAADSVLAGQRYCSHRMGAESSSAPEGATGQGYHDAEPRDARNDTTNE